MERNLPPRCRELAGGRRARERPRPDHHGRTGTPPPRSLRFLRDRPTSSSPRGIALPAAPRTPAMPFTSRHVDHRRIHALVPDSWRHLAVDDAGCAATGRCNGSPCFDAASLESVPFLGGTDSHAPGQGGRGGPGPARRTTPKAQEYGPWPLPLRPSTPRPGHPRHHDEVAAWPSRPARPVTTSMPDGARRST